MLTVVTGVSREEWNERENVGEGKRREGAGEAGDAVLWRARDQFRLAKAKAFVVDLMRKARPIANLDMRKERACGSRDAPD
jgi:hypothetical protein